MAKITLDKETFTLTNHETDKTYRFGQRGKKADWVQEWIDKNGIPNYKTEVVQVNPEDCEVTFDEDTKTFTNHTTGKIYSYGQKGMKPKWVVAHEDAEGITPPVKVRPVDPEDIEHKITYDEDTLTLTNHTLNKTYTFGKRGPRAKWVQAWMVENEAPKTAAQEKRENAAKPNQPKFKASPDGLREWHFKSEMNNQCIIVAQSEVDAIMLYNHHTKYPLTPRTLNVFWQETDYVCEFGEGVWRFNNELDSWEPYGDYKNRVDSAKIETSSIAASTEEEVDEEEVDDMIEPIEEVDEDLRSLAEEDWEEEAIEAAVDAFNEAESFESYDN